jgi:hypothetical protein
MGDQEVYKKNKNKSQEIKDALQDEIRPVNSQLMDTVSQVTYLAD